jgi:AcrR family transcriptional regulator
MADIASSLGMSVGNIYRCFESKRELNEALADRMLLAIRVTAQTIAEDRSASAEDRLRRMARAFYEYNRAQFTGDRRAFEIVAIAIGECWKPVRVHLAKIDRMIEMVIAEGVGRDEFRLTDVTAAAQCVRTIVVNFADPVLMSRQPKNMPPDLEQVLDFILAGLKNLG